MRIQNIKPTPEKYCLCCGKKLERKRYNGRLEDLSVFNRRMYCDMKCMGLAHQKEIPSKSAISKRLIKKRKPNCEMCGTTENLQMHHIDGNRYNNKDSNLMTLCVHCHTKWHWEHGKTMKRKYPACVVCGAESHAKVMCQKHWQRYKKYGDPMMTKIRIGNHWELTKEEICQPVGSKSSWAFPLVGQT